jgi:hypothetical protein
VGTLLAASAGMHRVLAVAFAATVVLVSSAAEANRGPAARAYLKYRAEKGVAKGKVVPRDRMERRQARLERKARGFGPAIQEGVAATVKLSREAQQVTPGGKGSRIGYGRDASGTHSSANAASVQVSAERHIMAPLSRTQRTTLQYDKRTARISGGRWLGRATVTHQSTEPLSASVKTTTRTETRFFGMRWTR